MTVSIPPARDPGPEQGGPDKAPGAAAAADAVLDGEMAERIAAFDWSTTPIGPMDAWSPALRMMVRFLLPNRFPMLLWWGPEYTCIYNDPYRPILGSKHPWALGRPTDEVWSEIWHVLQPLIDTPFHGGEATWNEDIELELRRHVLLEETHFTIAYSPVPDDTVPSGIGGVLATVNEITEKVVAERRVTALHDLSSHTLATGQEADPCRAAADAIAKHPKDIPFALLYLLEGDDRLCLAASTGVDPGSAAAPDGIRLDAAAGPWPAGEVVEAARPITVTGLPDLLGDAAPRGPWSDPPDAAVLLPIPSAIPHRPAGVLVAGVSARLALDDRYRSFLELVAGQIGTAVANSRAYEEERRRAEALAELDRAKTAFFSNVSHEFRTPLTMMLGPIRDVLEGDGGALAPRQRDQLELAERSSRRLLRLVNSLLDYSRIEAGRAEASFEETDLGALTSDLASQFRSAIERGGLALRVDVEPGVAPVYVDRVMWEKVVLNLLSNALKSTFDGEIAVHVRKEGGHVVLDVRDTGVGIAEEELPRVFDRFHRIAGAPSRTHEGSGIGLALVQEMVRLHGGEITVESRPGQGSTFRVRMPAGSAHLPAERIAAPRTLDSTATGVQAYLDEALGWLPDLDAGDGDGAQQAGEDEGALAATAAGDGAPDLGAEPAPGARLLVVDDNADMRQYVSRLLGRHWTVDVARDGDAALAALEEHHYDLVLSDVMMPGTDGLALVERIRRDPATRDVPVLLLSARAGEEARIEGSLAGADDYIVKPFSARELVARVGGALRLAEARNVAREELRRSEDALRESNEQLRSALAVKDEFLGLVSHELRTPLTVILGMSKVLERIGADDLRARELAGDVAESADVLNGLVESMLLLARLDRDEADILREPVLLHHAAERMLAERRRRDPSRPYVLRAGSSLEALVSVQPTWLERVIDNFVGNAAKYSTPGEPIEVVIETDDDEARLRVLDRGPGLDEDEMARVFEPFYRSPQARERAGGAGLGLAVAKRIVELLGGQIWVARAETGGAEFGFSLPLVTDPEP